LALSHNFLYLHSRAFSSEEILSLFALSKENKNLLLKYCWTLIERKNYGYDFGGYRDGVLFLSEKIRDLDKLKLDSDFAKLRYELSDFLRGLQKNK